MCTNKKSNHVLWKFYPDFKKWSECVLCRDFHLHLITCQKSSLGYVTLQYVTLQKHWNQWNCRHFPLMTGKCSQQKWKLILLIFDCMLNSFHNKWSYKGIWYLRFCWNPEKFMSFFILINYFRMVGTRLVNKVFFS